MGQPDISTMVLKGGATPADIQYIKRRVSEDPDVTAEQLCLETRVPVEVCKNFMGEQGKKSEEVVATESTADAPPTNSASDAGEESPADDDGTPPVESVSASDDTPPKRRRRRSGAQNEAD